MSRTRQVVAGVGHNSALGASIIEAFVAREHAVVAFVRRRSIADELSVA